MERFILYIDDALDGAVCDRWVRELARSTDGYPGNTAYGHIHEKKNSIDVDLVSKYWDAERKLLSESLQASLQTYARRNPSFGSIDRYVCRGFRSHSYPVGGGFDWHIDNFSAVVGHRILSCIWYLNDVTKGGETEFKYQSVSIAPKRGRLLLFPSGFDYLHRSAPSVSGEKHVIVGFVEHCP